MKDFIKFVREQGVVGLAIGFILGGSVSALVSSLVNDIINPLLGLVLGAVNGFSTAVIHLGAAEVKYGHFLGSVIDFVIKAFVVYFLFRGLAAKLDQKK